MDSEFTTLAFSVLPSFTHFEELNETKSSIMPLPDSSLEHILDIWRKEAAASGHNQERIKGTAFENLCIAFLTYDPVQKAQYAPPVTYAAWASGRGMNGQIHHAGNSRRSL